MHVNDKQFIHSYELGSSHNLRTNQEGSILGRTATVINPSINHTGLTKSATTANNQSVKISPQNQSPNSDKPLKVSALRSDSIQQKFVEPKRLDSCVDRELMMDQATQAVVTGASHNQVGILVGNKIVRSDSSELHGKDPSELDRSFFIFTRENGKRALAVEEDQLGSIQNVDLAYVDENGQTQHYDVIIIGQDISDLLQTVLDRFVEAHITPNLAPREKEKEHEKKEVDEKSTPHTPPQPPRYEYKPKIEEKQDNKELINDTSKLLSENPKVILKNVLEAESLLEAKKMNQERAQEAKKKLIDEQEERREIRHEGYKHDEIKQSKQQHDILNETIHHQETERPASVSTTQQSKQDEK